MTNSTYNQLIRKSRMMLDKPNSKYKHFSFIVASSKILSIGYNDIHKTHPLAEKYGHRCYATHSEISAISKFPYAPRYIPSYDMVNIRLNKKGDVRLSKPCVFCQLLLAAFNIPDIYYSIDDKHYELLKII